MTDTPFDRTLHARIRAEYEEMPGMCLTLPQAARLFRHSEELRRATQDPAWAVLTTPEYARQTAAFLRASEDLLEAAKRRDLEAAPLAYVSLTMSCVQCHRYVARMRIARSALAP